MGITDNSLQFNGVCLYTVLEEEYIGQLEARDGQLYVQ